VDVAAGARVQRGLVERAGQKCGLPRAPRVRPHVDRGDGVAGRVEAEEPVPEGGDADAGDVGQPGAGEHGVETRGDGGQHDVGIVLDTAVGGDRRLVGDAMEPTRHRDAGLVVQGGPRRGGADVEREDHGQRTRVRYRP